jgi:Pretoxin HINT domain/Pre-toxin TG
VTPPGGGGAVTPLDYRDGWTGNCVRSWWGGEGSGCAYGDRIALERQQTALENDVKNATGEAKVAAAERLSLFNANVQDAKTGKDSVGELLNFFNSPEYKNYVPAMKLAVNGVINRGLQLGTIGEKGLRQLNEDIKKYKYHGADSGKFWFGGSLETSGKLPSWLTLDNAKGALSFGLGFAPVFGDGLSIAGAILGYDPITGEDLGALRWLGLLGFIGLGNEAVAMAKAGRSIANEAKVLSRIERATEIGKDLAVNCLRNSFSAKTKVWISQTSQSLNKLSFTRAELITPKSAQLQKTKQIAKSVLAAVSISSLTIGTPVLAFNENLRQEQIQPVTATHVHNDPTLVKLTLETENGHLETIATTPEHPFYALTEARANSDGVWIDAGKLERGYWLKRAGGNYGVVKWVQFEQKTQKMYNLSVKTAHTFFVGEGKWLVHNCGWTSPAGLFYDLSKKDGNRVNHIMQHLTEDPLKKAHSVFDVGNSSELLPLIDEAWSNPLKFVPDPSDPGAFVVPMGKTVGTNGETAIRIIVIPGTNPPKIISAYPVKYP